MKRYKLKKWVKNLIGYIIFYIFIFFMVLMICDRMEEVNKKELSANYDKTQITQNINK